MYDREIWVGVDDKVIDLKKRIKYEVNKYRSVNSNLMRLYYESNRHEC